ncbi:MAG: hypothetical protein QM774_04575 [Gordonia sp. (in: high G+C Gram-positive bacteria)]|uniref:hypothetical protein n=1 Tax=Gordonia sp. (in: high G+C Gram-positive bacteria) TaxID=84139 RepID=UPI0039E584AE
MSEETATPTVTDDAPVTAPATAPVPADVVSSIRKYVASEGGSAKAVLQPIGEAGVRITLVGGQDGALGDRVVPTLEQAKAVVAEVDGLEEADEWDRSLTSTVSVAPSHWRKMAGWVAGQKRFPRPRNRKILD